MSAQVAADLRAAAEVLRRDGWTQGNYDKPDGSKRLVGALNVATGMAVHVSGSRAYAAREALDRHLGIGPLNYNDTPGRTADEVIAVLEAAAEAAS